MKVTVEPVVPVERTVTVEMTESEARALGEFCGAIGLQEVERINDRKFYPKFNTPNRVIFDASSSFYFATLGKV